jgi:hypothetical protein
MDRYAVFDVSPFIKSNIVKYERFKACLVAERYLEGIYFHESFSQVVKSLFLFHVMLALVLIAQLDVKIILHGVFFFLIRGCIWNNQNGYFIITTKDLFANSKIILWPEAC